jgi:hypothetical protein
MLNGTKTYIGLVQAISVKQSEVQRNIEQIASGRSPSRQCIVEFLLLEKTTLKFPFIPRIVGITPKIIINVNSLVSPNV